MAAEAWTGDLSPKAANAITGAVAVLARAPELLQGAEEAAALPFTPQAARGALLGEPGAAQEAELEDGSTVLFAPEDGDRLQGWAAGLELDGGATLSPPAAAPGDLGGWPADPPPLARGEGA